MDVSRRRLLAQTAAGLAFGGYARLAAAQTTPASVQAAPYVNQVEGYGPLKTDPFGVFDLPEGFSYTIVSEAGRPMSDGLVTPRKMDGMGCFPLGRDRVALVRNHELKFGADFDYGAFGVGQSLAGKIDKALVFDHDKEGRALMGGTSTLVYDLRRKRMETSHLSLVGTSTNCAGGVTPWGSWLTCEEITATPDAQTAHGWVFEVPSRHRGLVAPVPLKGMGRFRHEAACVDPRTGVVYLTEDEVDGLFYRYLPNAKGELHKGGRLQALAFKDGGGDSRNYGAATWRAGQSREAVWIDMDGVEAPDADLRQRGHDKGGVLFARGEGVFYSAAGIYFACTSGGTKQFGQIMRYAPSPHEGQAGERDQPGRVQLFVESEDKAVMQMCDNLAVAPWGHLFACEDKVGGVNFLKAVTPEGKVYTIGRQAQPGVSDVGANSEIAGVCFSPDGSTLFLNIYWPGATLAITGPWNSVRA